MLLNLSIKELRQLTEIMERYEREYMIDGESCCNDEFYVLKDKIKEEMDYYDFATQEN